MRHKLLFLPFLIAIVGLGLTSQRPLAQSSMKQPMTESPGLQVLELFTSQSCSSCPPADKLLNQLSARDDVLALSCHVTYWDHLNWRDTLSRDFCTDRQRAYAGFQNKSRIYTPQMVVNGQFEMVGSNRGSVLGAMGREEYPVLPIALMKSSDDTLHATLPPLQGERQKQTLWLMSYLPQHTQDIPSGENRGRTITYVNSVLTLDQVGTWDGEAKAITLDLPETTQDGVGYALIAQPRGFGPMRAAGKL